VGSCGQTSLLRRLAGQQHLRLTGVGAIEHQVHRVHLMCGGDVSIPLSLLGLACI